MTKPRRIAIIGGGPAGAQCARRLAETGLEVTLFEPRTRHEKACGGGIPARGLDRFPFLRDARLPVKTLAACLLVSPAGREARLPLDEPLYVFSRADLHAFMLDRARGAGARVVRARVIGFEDARDGAAGDGPHRWRLRVAEPDGGTLSEAGPFEYLVAADGAAGPARRRLAGADRPGEITQGIGWYVPGVSEDFITLKYFPSLHGYLWVFPRADHSSAGICGTLGAQSAASLKEQMREFLQERYAGTALSAAVPYAALIPGTPRDGRNLRLVGEGWGLIGDAARHVDPLTREGIYYAMLSGEILAESLARGEPAAYPAIWSRTCLPELSWAAAHGDGFFAPRFVETLVFLCARSRSIQSTLSDVIAGRQDYRSLKRRLLLSVPAVGAQIAAHALRGGLSPLRDS